MRPSEVWSDDGARPASPGGTSREGASDVRPAAVDTGPIVAFRGSVATGAPTTVETIAAIYDAEHAALYAFIRAAVRDDGLAEDILQDAFLRLVREIAAGRPPESVRPWLYRVAANLVITAGRRRVVAERHAHRLTGEGLEPSPEEAMIDQERDRDLHRALDELGPDARVAVLLSAHGWGGHEIGEALHRSDAAVRTLLCRARERLRRRLREQAEAGEAAG